MADDHEAAEATESAAPDSRPVAGGDVRARFREALARKHDSAHRSAEGRQNTGVVQGSEITGAAKRSFRRKTG